MKCNRDHNMIDCNCTSACDKKGMCCECISYHRLKHQFPACYFSKEGEATYDRSLESLIADWKKNNIL